MCKFDEADNEVIGMCNAHHAAEREAPRPMPGQAKSGPVIWVEKGPAPVRPEKTALQRLMDMSVSDAADGVLGICSRVSLCLFAIYGIADGLVDTGYGTVTAAIGAGWLLLYILRRVALG